MFITKGVSPGEIITFKLSSGEELIAKLIEETMTHFKISRPLLIAMSPQGPALMPYLFTVHPDKEIQLNKSGITVAVDTDKSFADQYIQSTTGIKLT